MIKPHNNLLITRSINSWRDLLVQLLGNSGKIRVTMTITFVELVLVKNPLLL